MFAEPKQTIQTMTTSTTNQQVIDLINRSFDSNGFLVNPKSRKNQSEAKQLLDVDDNFYGQVVNGFDTYNSLLMIAYPNAQI
jgi:hypothetical protein